ncbi:hypothetical protein K443DRAFT_12256 [Laccaria amethystina LaAM-08-1]|uniref:Uncharacterized protein n=1 Tax=Laccaria amethystina LaAM-08-1 TaxID=1095629 RepID=A0A0C9XDH8_9AGAR|nr:hypothetical protein K443DRAFT_12256 [Laccaria amethystina LaAM-08-1]
MDHLRLSYSKRLAHKTVLKRKSGSFLLNHIIVYHANHPANSSRNIELEPCINANVPPSFNNPSPNGAIPIISRVSSFFPMSDPTRSNVPSHMLPHHLPRSLLSQCAHKGEVGCRRSHRVNSRRSTVVAFADAVSPSQTQVGRSSGLKWRGPTSIERPFSSDLLDLKPRGRFGKCFGDVWQWR